jgi:hypothetical protein
MQKRPVWGLLATEGKCKIFDEVLIVVKLLKST